jgi:hypothetical protein
MMIMIIMNIIVVILHKVTVKKFYKELVVQFLTFEYIPPEDQYVRPRHDKWYT